MTEKRFEEQNLENHLNRIYDAKKGKVVFDEDIVDLLNALHEENIELQGMYDAQKQLYCQLNSNKNNIWQDYQDLKKENEQLKKEIAKFKAWEKYVGDVKREDLDKVFKMSIYEIAEAFEYYRKRIKELEE